MDIDYLKWKIEMADGFEWVIDQEGDTYIKETITGIKMFVASECFEEFNIYPILNPLLTQRAIEGVNKEMDKYVIHQGHVSIHVISTKVPYSHMVINDGITNDSKESALKYIYDQRSNK